ncbi:MAG TPA: response regulator [Bauldia sp.]|nr:response regulator [Bauldia sp.]
MANGTAFGLTTPDGRRPRVAVVCGNVADAAVTIMLAEQFGTACYAAQSGEGALALLRRDPIDLVLLDLALPDMDALVALQLIRALGARGAMPVVAIAETAEAGAPGRAAGFAGTVARPFSPRELYAAMQAALARASAAAGIR